jgi:hypothetical protein
MRKTIKKGHLIHLVLLAKTGTSGGKGEYIVTPKTETAKCLDPAKLTDSLE